MGTGGQKAQEEGPGISWGGNHVVMNMEEKEDRHTEEKGPRAVYDRHSQGSRPEEEREAAAERLTCRSRSPGILKRKTWLLTPLML